MTDTEITLEPEGLEAAQKAFSRYYVNVASDGFNGTTDGAMRAAIRAYLSRSTLPREGQPTDARLAEMINALDVPGLGAAVLRGDDLADVRSVLAELRSLRALSTQEQGE